MKEIIFLGLFETDNVGDRFASPYFWLKEFVNIPHVMDYGGIQWNIPRGIDTERFQNAFLILGGGGHIHLPSPEYNKGRFGHLEELAKFPNIVAYAIGHNVHTPDFSKYDVVYPTEVLNKFKLVGIRDIWQHQFEYEHVFDPTCMSAAFNKIPRTNKSGSWCVVEHRTIPLSIDINTNSAIVEDFKTIQEVLSYISKYECIVTNSYHVAYWSKCINRHVILYKPFSTRFYTQGIPVTEDFDVMNQAVAERLGTPAPYKGFLKTARDSNRAFMEKVVVLVEEYLSA